MEGLTLCRRMSFGFWIVVGLTATGVSRQLAAQAPAPPPPASAFALADVDSVVARVEELVRRRYGFDDKKAALVAGLREAHRRGRYRTANAHELASLITGDLKRISGDEHLGLAWDPALYRDLAARESAVTSGAEAPGAAARFEVMARRINDGLSAFQVMPGNVRYLRLSRFEWRPDASGAVYDAAMQFLREGDAAIIDLRDNTGGDGSAVRYAISHFLPPDERLLFTFQDDEGRPQQSRALSYLPSGRVKVPLFVLINNRTRSAAEEFAMHVREFKLGTLVGEKTGGAGRSNAHFAVAPGFALSLSLYSPRHGLTNTNWEGVGIAPHVAAPSDRALETAHLAALERLLPAQQAGEDRSAVEWEIEGIRSRLTPVSFDTAAMQRYVGSYGERRVSVDGGRLVFQRPGRPAVELLPLAEHRFSIPGNAGVRVRFQVRDGRATAVETYSSDGFVLSYPRTP